MSNKLGKLFLSLLLSVCATSVVAVNQEHKDLVESVLKRVVPSINFNDLQIESVDDLALFKAVVGAEVFYVSKNGKYFFYGDLLDTKTTDQRNWNLTENSKRKVRKVALRSLPVKDLIIFKSKKHKHTKPIGVVTVFTDVDCPYGNKFYKESEKALEAGVEIRYALFPRAGIGSDSYKKAVSIWCAKDHNRAFSMANNGEAVPEKTCKNNPVENQYNFARKVGVNATPSILLSNGMLIPGFVNSDSLINLVKDANASSSS